MIARSVYLICDGDGCINMSGQWDANNASQARQIAKHIGWTRRDGKDLCDQCSTKPRSE